MKESSYASSLALSLKKIKDFYVLFQSGSGAKESGLSELQSRTEKKPTGPNSCLIYLRLVLIHGAGISKQKLFLRDGKQQNTYLEAQHQGWDGLCLFQGFPLHSSSEQAGEKLGRVLLRDPIMTVLQDMCL